MTLPLACALVLTACTGLAAAAPPPPPPPPTTPEQIAANQAMRQLIASSCDRADAPAATPISYRLEPLTARSLGGRADRIGGFTLKWAYRIHSDDPRLARITGLELDGELGLVAVTADRHWLAFDWRGDGLAPSGGITAAPLRGLDAEPGRLRATGGAYLVNYPTADQIAFADIRACGLAARPVPYIGVSPREEVRAILPLYFNEVLFAGAGAHGQLADTSRRLQYPTYPESGLVNMGQRSLLPPGGHALVDLANPGLELDTHGLVALWRSERRPDRSTLQVFDLPQYAEFPGAPSRRARMLVRVPLRLEAVTAAFEGPTRWVFAVTRAEPGQPTTLLALTFQP